MLEDIGQVALWVVLALVLIAGGGWFIAYTGFLAVVLPFAGVVNVVGRVRRTRKILRDVGDQYDGDGYRKHRSIGRDGAASSHYYLAASGLPLLPLSPYRGRPRGVCVTVAMSGNAVYVDREGRPLKSRPRGLRGVDPQEWLEDRQRACGIRVRDHIDKHMPWYIDRAGDQIAATA